MSNHRLMRLGAAAGVLAVAFAFGVGSQPATGNASRCDVAQIPADREVNTDLNVEEGTLRAAWTDDKGVNQEVLVAYRDSACLRNPSVKRMARHAVETYIPVLESHCASVNEAIASAGDRASVPVPEGEMNVARARDHVERWCDSSLGGVRSDPVLR